MTRFERRHPGAGARTAQWRPARRGALLIAGAALMGACDLGVSNPAVIGDEDLNDPLVVNSVIDGAISDVYLAAMGTNSGGGIFTGVALLTDEMVTSADNAGYIGLSEGTPEDESSDAANRWAWASRARWTTEDALRRLSGVVENPSSDPRIGTISLWAGFANRLMGDNFCNAVVNGGPLEDHTVYLQRAEDRFTQALEIANAAGDDSLRLAAYAGRAQTRIMLGDWSGAVADAGQVPTEFDIPLLVSPTTARTRNAYAWLAHDGRQFTLWGTPFVEWGLNLSDTTSTGDPRVPYFTPRDTLDQYVTGSDDRRPFFQQRKYTLSEDDSYMVRGLEMRLIEAEAALRNNDVGTAIAKINEAREHYNQINDDFRYNDDLDMVDPADVNSTGDAWDLLMRERGLMFYLEGRRLADLRRWVETPGVTVPYEVVRDEAEGRPAEEDLRAPVTDAAQLCFPISRNERLSNPNIS